MCAHGLTEAAFVRRLCDRHEQLRLSASGATILAIVIVAPPRLIKWVARPAGATRIESGEQWHTSNQAQRRANLKAVQIKHVVVVRKVIRKQQAARATEAKND